MAKGKDKKYREGIASDPQKQEEVRAKERLRKKNKRQEKKTKAAAETLLGFKGDSPPPVIENNGQEQNSKLETEDPQFDKEAPLEEQLPDVRADPTTFYLDATLAQVVVMILSIITLLGSFALALILNSSPPHTYTQGGDSEEKDDSRVPKTQPTSCPTPTGTLPSDIDEVMENDTISEGNMDVDIETDPNADANVDNDKDTNKARNEGANGGMDEGGENIVAVANAGINVDKDGDSSAMNRDSPLRPNSFLGGADTSETVEDNAFLLELSRLELKVSEWSMSWGGVDKFAGYVQLGFYRAIMKDDVIYRFSIADDDDDAVRDTEPPQPPPPFSIGYFFKRWHREMMEKVQEGDRLLFRAKFLGGGMVSWITAGGKDTSLLQMSWWKYQFLWRASTSIIQELSRGMGKIDASCQLLMNHPDFDFRPTFSWRPPYRPPFNPCYDFPPERMDAPGSPSPLHEDILST